MTDHTYSLSDRVAITRAKPPHRLSGQVGTIVEILPDHEEEGEGDLLIVQTDHGRRVPCFGPDVEPVE